jgi:phage tail sheath protein FI
MAFQLSPGVLVTEKDLTAVIPQVATTAGAFAGDFLWGPVDQVVTVSSENNLVARYGKPNDNTFASFFTAANFLAYGNNLNLARSVGSASKNAKSNAAATAILIKNDEVYTATYSDGSGSAVGEWAAKYPGALGNSLKVSIADANVWAQTWAYASSFDGAPSTSTYVSNLGGSNDEMHVIVIDEDGLWTGTANTVLERFSYVSKALDGKRPDGTSAYYKDVINQQSKYIWWMGHNANVNATSATVAGFGTAVAGLAYANLYANATSYPTTVSLAGGVDSSPVAGNVQSTLALFVNDEKYDISLMPMGSATAVTVNYAISSIAEVRKDIVVFASPTQANVVNNAGNETTDITTFRNSLTNSSYAFLDSGWKYQYDRYNDKYRWVPLNGDTAGLAARTDFVADPWFSPAGFNRGQIKNVVKLSYSPSKTDRDTLYKIGVNPVASFPGNGVALFGDKTLLGKPSAFDRINVRRLFIVLEKAIATAAKYQLFEFNDGFTRAQFKNLVEPFLRDVKGRRGVTDYKVVCDDSNNTGEVIDRNEFVADIYIKPARAINFIQLNFVATRTGISFAEIGA